MNIDSLLKRLYHKVPDYYKTSLGLTNDIYIVILDDQKYALRIPNHDIMDLMPHCEKEVLGLTRGLDLDFEEVYYDEKSRIRITKWVDDLVEFKDSKDPLRYHKTVSMIKKFHSLNQSVSENFDVLKIFKSYLKKVKNPLFNFEDHIGIIQAFLNLEESYHLCHNDLVSGNILFSKERSYLIDYEYAANNHPYFDLLSFISENEIDDPALRTSIFKDYFDGQIGKDLLEKLALIENCQNLLWACWANMLYDSRGEDIYLKIFRSKIEHLKRKNEAYIYY